MTNLQGVAAVSRTLAYFLGAVIRPLVPEARVTLARPEQPPAAAAAEPRLNVYLVQVVPDPAFRTQDLPTRTAGGQVLAPPQAPLTLRYLFSYFGPWEEAQVMLGATEVALREAAYLEPELIRSAVADHHGVSGSGLEYQQPPVRIVPAGITLDVLTHFWSGFQMPYTLSTLWEAGPVILTSDLPAEQPPLVTHAPRTQPKPSPTPAGPA